MIPKAKIKVMRTTGATGEHLEAGDIAIVSERDARVLVSMGKAELVIEGPAHAEEIQTRPEPPVETRTTRGRRGRPKASK